MRADLLIGGTLGGAALRRLDPTTIATVVTDDDALAAQARALGLAVTTARTWSPARRGLSVHYQRIVPEAQIRRYDGLWNLHPALLPHGRGFYPVFWALYEGTPAGATLHELVTALDAGPIVDQNEVAVRPGDTGGSLHARVQAAELALLDRWWPPIVAGAPLPSRPQREPAPRGRTRAEFFSLKSTGWRELDATALARLERCLTFPGHGGVERG
jgi:hypothetical protein